jgi:rhodanese-related sulfurtransferase
VEVIQSPQLIDVRTPQEYAEGHLQGATLISVQARNFEQHIQQLNPQQPVFVYCYSGKRSLMAARRLSQMGFTMVYDLQGGLMQWTKLGLPLAQ